jgi:hypothetical protein
MDSRRSNRHFIVGVLILLLGFVLLLDQLGFVEANRIFMFWPLILIYFGLNRFLRHRESVARFWGGFLVLLGVSFQLEELGLSHIHIATIWPVFLICAGVLLILRRYENRNRWPDGPIPGPPPGPVASQPPEIPPEVPPGAPPGPATAAPPGPSGPSNYAPFASGPGPTQSNFAGGRWDNSRRSANPWDDFHHRMDEFGERVHDSFHGAGNWSDSSAPLLNEVNIFWGRRRRIISKNFVGGEIVNIFGGFDVDLRESDIQGTEVEIEVVTIFGGGEIRVPGNWEVIMETVGIFGGCNDHTVRPDRTGPGATAPNGSPLPQPKRLVIKGVAIFGGLAIKN